MSVPLLNASESMMEAFSGEKYRSLESIFLWEEDITYLASQPGYTPEIGRQQRKARRKLAHEWMRELQADFDDVYNQLLVILVQSETSRPDLNRSLWRLKLTFYKRLTLLKLRLLFNTPVIDEVQRLSAALEVLIGYGWIVEGESPAT